ncbi:twitching motility protein PilT [Candidatus Woesearchaeota archaeon]|nr:twitching motility protein PilT [Candidatus Woesearchaeota archaeon]
MKKIILDTNFLLIPIQFRLDIFSEIDRLCLFRYKLYIVDKTIDELKGIMEKQKGKHKEAAKIALQLIKKKNIGIIKTKEGMVDDLILDLLQKGSILATEDRLLREKALKKGIRVIMLRSGKYLILK